MAESRGAQLLELALEGGGGAIAGFVDTKYDKKVAGMTLGLLGGALLSVGAIAVGPKALGGMAGYVGDLGGGMVAFEAGMMASNFLAKKKMMDRPQAAPTGPDAGNAGVFRRRSAITAGSQAPRVVSRQELYRSIAELGELQRV